MPVLLRCVLVAAGLARWTLPAQDWPRFRGPNGSGVAETQDLPVQFGAGQNLVWKTPVPFGRSSPIVAGGRVFLTASEGDRLLTLCLEAKTGRVLWRREIVRARTTVIYKGNDAASPTPASDGTNVYVFFADFGLVSYGPDGNERWRLPLGPFHSFYGMAGSPIVARDTVILVCDARSKPFVVAVEASTGRVRWRRERHTGMEGFATPVVYSPEKEPAQVIALGSHRLDAYSLDTGEPLWWTRRVGYLPKGTPVLWQDAVFTSAPGMDQPMRPPWPDVLQQHDKNGDGRLAPAEADQEGREHFGWADANGDGYIDQKEYDFIRTSGLGDYGLVAIRMRGRGDLSETSASWRYTKAYASVPAPLVYQDVLYVVKTGGIVTTLDPATGQVWKSDRTKEAMGEYFASPVAGDGKVYLVNESGKVTVLRAGKQWEILAVSDLADDCWATPAIGEGKIYIRTRGALYGFGRK